jgi:hypothetical protein
MRAARVETGGMDMVRMIWWIGLLSSHAEKECRMKEVDEDVVTAKLFLLSA